MTISNDRIVHIAGLQLQLHQQGGKVPPEVKSAFLQALGGITTVRDGELIGMAAALLAGERYAIVSDNCETVAACRSLAEHMGAAAGSPRNSEEHRSFARELGVEGDSTMIVFSPRQSE
jgi:hypothetical protein